MSEINESLRKIAARESFEFQRIIQKMCIYYEDNQKFSDELLNDLNKMLLKFHATQVPAQAFITATNEIPTVTTKIINAQCLDPFDKDVDVGLLYVNVPIKYSILYQNIFNQVKIFERPTRGDKHAFTFIIRPFEPELSKLVRKTYQLY